MTAEIEVYTWPTPNGHKIHIMLEETGTPYKVRAINIRAGDQFQPEFLRIRSSRLRYARRAIPARSVRSGATAWARAGWRE